MRIGIDGGCWSNQRGYGRFLREILRALDRTQAPHEYVVFLDPVSARTFDHDDSSFKPVVVNTRQSITMAAAANGNRSLQDVLRMTRAAQKTKLDLFFFPSVYSYFPVFGRLPVVLCIHDTIPERNPSEHFDSWRQSLAWRMKVGTAILQSSRIVTVSHYSKRCLRELLGVRESTIRVVYEAASPEFQPGHQSRPNDRPYILYVGGFSPHKNLMRLVRAFGGLKPQFPELRLVLAGDYKTDSFKGSYPALARMVRDLGLEGDVEFPGFVPDADLPGLYSGAAVVALPSVDEGFGLPALEAMACGVPVVVSSGNAMEEIVGDAGIVVNPYDAEAVGAAIGRVLSDRALDQRLRQAAIQRALEFSWDRSADQLLAVFNEFEERR